MKLGKESYQKLINDDAKWLIENTGNSLERQHILRILWDSISLYYPDAPQETP